MHFESFFHINIKVKEYQQSSHYILIAYSLCQEKYKDNKNMDHV